MLVTSACVGMPLITPLLKINPEGSAGETLNVLGARPPVPVATGDRSVIVLFLVRLIAGLFIVNANAGSSTTNVIVTVSVWGTVNVSVAVIT